MQNNRLLTVTIPIEAESVFLIHCEVEEKLSSSFDIHMTLMSNKPAIDPDSLIGKSVTVAINTSVGNEPRYFNGLVQSFIAGTMEEGLYTYTARATSWLSFLDLAVDCRIFQHKSVPDIVTGILQEFGFNEFDTSRLHNKYQPLEYCTQYSESTFNFINRLLAEAGIFYFFKHTKNKHILMLSDTSSMMPNCYEKTIQFNPQGNLRDHYLFTWQRNYKSYAGKTAHIDYDFEKPYVTLAGKQGKPAKSKFVQSFEVYHPNVHQNTDEANAKANLQFEAYEAEHTIIEGGGTYSSFTCGGCFNFPESNQEADNSEYFLTRVSHIATDNSYLTHDIGESIAQAYQNYFTCIPKATPYKTFPFKFD